MQVTVLDEFAAVRRGIKLAIVLIKFGPSGGEGFRKWVVGCRCFRQGRANGQRKRWNPDVAWCKLHMKIPTRKASVVKTVSLFRVCSHGFGRSWWSQIQPGQPLKWSMVVRKAI